MDLEKITENKEIQEISKQANPQGNLESKIESDGSFKDNNFSFKPRKRANILLQTYNKGLGDIPWALFDSASFTLINSKRFISSPKYRSEVVKDYMRKKIDSAEKRNELDPVKAHQFQKYLKDEKVSPYLFDFFMHTVGLNLAGFGLGCYFVYIPLFSGNTSFLESVARAGITGSITRTAWTTGRIAYDCLRKVTEKRQDKTHLKEIIKSSFKERSVAFWEELWPFWGVTAYPKQMYRSECEINKEFGEFLINDIRNSIESKIPPLKYTRISLNKAYMFSKSLINNTKKDIEFYFDKIYKGLIHIDTYGTNKNNRDKRVE